MTRRMQRRNAVRRYLPVIIAIWCLILIITTIADLIHFTGWIILTAGISSATYMLGRSRASGTIRIDANRRYGKPGMFQTDINSAYPVRLAAAEWQRVTQADYSVLRGQITEALTGLGWPKSSIKAGTIDTAISDILATGQEPTIHNVLPVILRKTGEAKSRRAET